MVALALDGGGSGPRGGGGKLPLGWIALAGGLTLVGFLVWSLLSAQLVSKRPNEMKTTQVVLPPPPPPPPPPPKPQEKPPEPADAPPLEQPQDTPPPPDQAQQSSEPTVGDSAMTAREGAGPSNYGLAVGNGSGTRIGGRPGGSGDGYGAYAQVALSAIRLATQSDRELARGRYTTRLAVSVDEAGRITDVRVIGTSGDSRRDERLRRVLAGLQLARRPPPGLPVMRIELNARSGG
ncbi:energy transducer TonB [Novosphingobium gossypii]|uniref:TonB-dependent receptor n=1 Tax=Novosphingobium gossypii TaxID=1604774 RepID=UPI003D22CEFC